MRITQSNLETIFNNFVHGCLNGKVGYSSGSYRLDENCNKWGIVYNTTGGYRIVYPIAYSKKELYWMLHFAISMHREKESD